MNFFNRFLNAHDHRIHHDRAGQAEHGGQPDQAGQAGQLHLPAQPPPPPSALTLVAPALLAPLTCVAPGPRLPELSPQIMAALEVGFSLFPILVGSLNATSTRAFLPAASNDVEELRELASLHPQCQFGMLVNGRFCAVRMEGEFGYGQFIAMAKRAFLLTPDDHADEFGTRLLCGGNTIFAIYLSPELERRRHLPDLGIGLSIVREWVPAPGSVFKGVRYQFVDPASKIAPLPRNLAELVFENPEARQESTVIEFPAWLPR